MIYGANGYTGTLVAEEAVRRGHRPVLAGRNANKIAPLAKRLDLEFAVFDLKDEARIVRQLLDVDLVYHTAGPFTMTSAPMLRACLISRTHYLDCAGEIGVFEHTFAHDEIARKAGITAISGIGFDVIPSDCLIAHVAAQVPNPTRLRVGIQLASFGRVSVGTARSMLEILARDHRVRHEGALKVAPLGRDARDIPFARVTRRALAIPWGDLSTAYHTMGIPDIITYIVVPQPLMALTRVFGLLVAQLVKIKPLRRLLQAMLGIFLRPKPSAGRREHSHSSIWVQVADEENRTAEGWLDTLEGYQFTMIGGVRAIERIIETLPVGALSPAQALGADFVLGLPGTTRYDERPA